MPQISSCCLSHRLQGKGYILCRLYSKEANVLLINQHENKCMKYRNIYLEFWGVSEEGINCNISRKHSSRHERTCCSVQLLFISTSFSTWPLSISKAFWFALTTWSALESANKITSFRRNLFLPLPFWWELVDRRLPREDGRVYGVAGTELGRLMLVLELLRPMFLPRGNLWRLSEEFPRRKIDENSSSELLNCCSRLFDVGLVVPVGLEVPGRTVATSSVVAVEGKALKTVLRVSWKEGWEIIFPTNSSRFLEAIFCKVA